MKDHMITPDKTDTPQPSGDRIAKVLARAGVASRRQAEILIVEGRVCVNGKRIDSPALNVTPSDRITVDGKPLRAPEPARLWLYHKPLGLVTTTRDDEGRPTVFDNLPEGLPRVVSVGRLDLNSEGLLLLTNDGALKRKLELPSTGWLRKYRVRVNGAPTDEMLAPLREGIVVEGENFQPMIVAIDRQQGANAWLTIGIREGRNREIRRALSYVGLSVNRLIRISYGPFQLGTLAKGAVEEVKARVLREQLGEGARETETDAPKPPRKQKPRPPVARGDRVRKDDPAAARTGRPPARARPTRKP
jgi:23S rRNA pseudouridine2605 synthase